MGNNEINSYLNKEDSFSFLLRDLTVKTPIRKKTFLENLSELSMDIAMVAAPLLTYFFQINKFRRTKSSKGFSKLICFLLFMGNIFRIFFWFGTRFKKTLLIQSTGIVIFQVILIHLCIKYKDDPEQKNLLPNLKNDEYNGQKPLIYYILNWKETFTVKKIWKWDIEIEYYKFMFFIIFILSVLCEIFQNLKFFFHILGVMSAFFESMTCVPQVIENYKTKNSKNVSFSMIFCWFLGDSFRLYYNIKFKAPIQMITAISIQVALDLTVCIQLCIYKDGPNKGGILKNKKIEDIKKIVAKNNEMNMLSQKKETKEQKEGIEIELKRMDNTEGNENEKNEPKLDNTNNSDPDTSLK